MLHLLHGLVMDLGLWFVAAGRVYEFTLLPLAYVGFSFVVVGQAAGATAQLPSWPCCRGSGGEKADGGGLGEGLQHRHAHFYPCTAACLFAVVH